MPEIGSLGKTLIYIGLFLIIIGVIFHFGEKIFSFGKLPGDITIQRDGFSFSFPIVTCVIISIVLTIVLNLFSRL